MRLTEAQDLCAYNEWANALLWDAAAPLPDEAWRREFGDAFPSLLALAVHMVGAEQRWLMRWQGEMPSGRPSWADDPSPERLRAVLAETERKRRAFLATHNDETLARPLSFTLADGKAGSLPLSTLVRHLVNHGSYHRGQFSSLLRRNGVAPPTVDYLFFALASSR